MAVTEGWREGFEDHLVERDVRAIENALFDPTVLSRDLLARACGATGWAPGHFERALRQAIREGRIHSPGHGWYARGPAPVRER